MQIVTDCGVETLPSEIKGIKIHYIPLPITIDGKIYLSRVNITSDEFYNMQENALEIPTTSQPSPGDFKNLYKKLAKEDPDILSIHMSSGFSGTINAARVGARAVPEANVEFYDTKAVSAAEAWHVEMAAKAIGAGWDKPRILSMLKQVSEATDSLFTISTLKYLAYGGRISHLKALIASTLSIKPIIGIDKGTGKTIIRGKERTMPNAIDKIVDIIGAIYPPGTPMRTQAGHTQYPEGADRLQEKLDTMFECTWLPKGQIEPFLGAHVGKGFVGVVFAPKALFPKIP
jgi:DegV family protein with EDD domain